MQSSLAHSEYLDSQFDTPRELPRAGCALENPYVFDDAARELKRMADQGLAEILVERRNGDRHDALINRLSFRRLR